MLHRRNSEILKVQEFYLSRNGKDALLECVTIEHGTACDFFVQLKLHEKAITVRLLPATDPEKTPAVKKVMVLIARFVRKVYPESRYGKTNLQQYLETPMDSDA
jgi:hypothetical protein